jgi:hypothetical protein
MHRWQAARQTDKAFAAQVLTMPLPTLLIIYGQWRSQF